MARTVAPPVITVARRAAARDGRGAALRLVAPPRDTTPTPTPTTRCSTTRKPHSRRSSSAEPVWPRPREPQRVPPAATELAAELGTTQLEWIVALPAGAWTVKLTRDAARVTKIDRDRLQRDATRLASTMRLGRSDWQQAAGDLDATLALDPSTDPVVVIPVGSAVEDVSFGALPSLTETRLRVCWSGAHWMWTRVDRHVRRVTIAATGVEGSSREVGTAQPGVAGRDDASRHRRHERQHPRCPRDRRSRARRRTRASAS